MLSPEFQYRKRYGLHAITKYNLIKDLPIVSIPQAVRIACNMRLTAHGTKREAVSIPQAVRIACNTATEFVLPPSIKEVSIPQAVRIACNQKLQNIQQGMTFQYRKRYGLHAMYVRLQQCDDDYEFQYRKRYGLHAILVKEAMRRDDVVSIPQAVRIACNLTKTLKRGHLVKFQYRKRYGLHAIWLFLFSL